MKRLVSLSFFIVAFMAAAIGQIENGGVYVFQSEAGTVLDVSGGSKDNGASIQLWDSNDSPAQKFKLIESAGGFWHIQSVNSGKVLDISGGNDVPGTNIQQWEPNYTASQKFKILDAGDGMVYLKSSQGNFISPETIHGKKGSNVFLWNDDMVAKYKMIKQ